MPWFTTTWSHLRAPCASAGVVGPDVSPSAGCRRAALRSAGRSTVKVTRLVLEARACRAPGSSAITLGREDAVGRHDLDRRAGLGDHLGRLHRRMIARVVIDQHAPRRASRRPKGCPRLDTVSSSPASDLRSCGRPPVATTTTSGLSASTSVRLGPGVEAELDAARARTAPCASRRSRSSRAGAESGRSGAPGRRAATAASNTVTSMAALGRNARRLQSRRTGADDHDALARCSAARDRRAASSPRARSRRCGCTAPRRPDRCGRGNRSRRRRGGCPASRPCDDLAHDMRVGHVGARHPDHVELARRRWRGARSPHRGCARHGRSAGRPRPGSRPAKSRCGADRMPWIGMTSVSAASVSIWPRMMFRKSTSFRIAQQRRDAHALLPVRSRRRSSSRRIAHAHRNSGPDPLAAARPAPPCVKRSAVLETAAIGRRPARW